jgi:hypothetical protein
VSSARGRVEFTGMDLSNFIFVPGHAINPAAISHLKYNKDGSVHVMVNNDTLTFEGDAAKVFFDAAPKPAPVAAPKNGKTPPAPVVE